jgi:hypothetical protein
MTVKGAVVPTPMNAKGANCGKSGCRLKHVTADIRYSDVRLD